MVKEFIKSLEYAAILQKGALPKERHFTSAFDEHFVIYQPAQIVSGDFYWVSKKGDNKFLVVGDCTGHGVPGSMLMMLMVNLIIYAIQKPNYSVSETLRQIDKKFLETFEYNDPFWDYGNDWVDLAFCKINDKKGTVEFGGAHKKILHFDGVTINTYKGNSYPIGGWQIEQNRNYETTSFSFKKGDVLYMGSDGFQDQIGEQTNKRFGSSRLFKSLSEIVHLPLAVQKEILVTQHNTWKQNSPQTDDICVVGIKL